MAISFETPRLKVSEIQQDIPISERSALIERITEILTPLVVENLPPYFHGIDSPELADAWLDRMLSESRLFQVGTTEITIIGFLFVSVEDNHDAHIGYLLSEEFWGKGIASELLRGFISAAPITEPWTKLVGGVVKSNIASANLLRKLGFVAQSNDGSDVVFYEYVISQTSA